MIIPGLDRLDGTQVNGSMDDETWHEHTTELMDEYQKLLPSTEVSMMEFCRDYAQGLKKTRAMLKLEARAEAAKRVTQAAVRSEFKPDAWAARLSQHQGRGWPVADSEGLVLALAGFVFKPANAAARAAVRDLQEALDAIEPGAFYATPEHALHVTVCTPQKFNQASVVAGGDDNELWQTWARCLRASRELAEAMQYPIALEVNDVVFLGGNSVVVMFDDAQGCIARLRGIVLEIRDDVERALPHRQGQCLHQVPDICHSTVARLARAPADPVTFSAKLRDVLGTGMMMKRVSVVLSSLELVRDTGYMVKYPEGVVAVVSPQSHRHLAPRSKPGLNVMWLAAAAVAVVGVLSALAWGARGR